MRFIKVTRILKYVGPEDWIEMTLEKSLVTEKEPLWQCGNSIIQQISLTKERLNETSSN